MAGGVMEASGVSQAGAVERRLGLTVDATAVREAAYVRAFELAMDAQTPHPGTVKEIAALLEEGLARDWPEVVRAAMFADAAASKGRCHGAFRDAVQRLLSRAETDAAPAMIAVALALRATRDVADGDSRFGAGADGDLVRASVILESSDGPVIERISAHNSCAMAYGERWLWEIADEQYAVAMKLAPDPPPPWARFVLPAVVYNRAEMQVSWACILRQLGDETGVRERWQVWQEVITAAPKVGMPASWQIELRALGTLIGALAREDIADDARAQLEALDPSGHPGASPEGWLQLAIAVADQREGRLETAHHAVEHALATIDCHQSGDAYDLALCIAAELESVEREDTRHPAAAMRYARRQLALRWSYRSAAHGSVLGRIESERLRREHDVVTQQAHLDDLTALLNRRGFARYLESIARQSIGTISLLVADLDRFKRVNDRFGHQVGDMVLISVGQVLHAHVRPADCAVRLGGDEFAIVLASAPPDIARRRAEALIDAVRRHPWHELAPGLSITISVGFASGATADFEELTERADRALYSAKRQGRNRVVSDSAHERARGS